MSEISRNTDPNVGPLDGVNLDAKGVVTTFDRYGSKNASIKKQRLYDVHIKASYDLGTVSITIPKKSKMVTVRIDEMLAVMKSASDASNEVRKEVAKNEGSQHI